MATAQLEILKKADTELQKKFDIVVQVVLASFLKRDVNIHEILSSLQFIRSYEEEKMVKNLFKELLEAQSLHELFYTFSDIWNYIHPQLLEFIVERFGTTRDKDIVKEYKEDLEKYRRNVKLGDFVKMFKSPLPFNKELSPNVGEDWRHETLQDFEDSQLLRALPKKVSQYGK